MPAALPVGKIAAPALRWPRWAAMAAVLAGCAAFMFAGPASSIQLWDESRVMVNALEMRGHAWSLVTTYGGRPDLWNTKPPLLVWAMDASMALFGPSVAAMRLPAALSALGVLAIVFGFVRRLSGSAWTAALAAALLTLSFGFGALHAARTADYDAPLTLFTTGYAVTLFFAAHLRRAEVWRLALAAGLILGAVLTKSIAGLIPGMGFGLYLLAVGRWRRPLAWRYAVAGAVVLAAIAGFLLAREHAAPGSLAADLSNNVSGRFAATAERHGGSPLYYVYICFLGGFFSAGPLALAAPFGLRWAKGRARLGLMFSLCMALGVLGIDSAASTKLAQYAVPAYPFLAMACAFAVHAGARALPAERRRLGLIALSAALALVALRAAELRYVYLPHIADRPEGRYGELFETLSARGVQHLQVLDDGVADLGVSGAAATGLGPHYAPELRAYMLLWRPKGLEVRQVSTLAADGGAVATCDPSLLERVRALGPDISGVPGCAVARR